jgi:hypothetical protein
MRNRARVLSREIHTHTHTAINWGQPLHLQQSIHVIPNLIDFFVGSKFEARQDREPRGDQTNTEILQAERVQDHCVVREGRSFRSYCCSCIVLGGEKEYLEALTTITRRRHQSCTRSAQTIPACPSTCTRIVHRVSRRDPNSRSNLSLVRSSTLWFEKLRLSHIYRLKVHN